VGLGLGLVHYIPLVAYIGFWIMCGVSLTGRPLLGLYYMIPFLPYRTLREHFLDYPLGGNVLTILVFSVIVGALLKGKRLPKSKLYGVWLIFGIYLYISMWYGAALGNAPVPLWISDPNFATWKDFMLIPLTFVAAGLVVEDRQSVRRVIIITAVALLLVDRSCILESLSRSWGSFNEDKRYSGPLSFGSNETAAFLAQFAMFFWGMVQFVKRRKVKFIFYGIVATTIFATMYTFSRGSYVAVLFSIFVLGALKDRKLLLIGAIFLFTWQLIVPVAVRERVAMTQSSSGQLEASANERVRLWEDAEQSMLRSPILGNGYATYQLGTHLDNLRDTHNWYVKVVVETGIVGLIIAFAMFQQMFATAYRLFKTADDPLYQGLGLGLFVAFCSCTVANFFGDRWTAIEITGMLWVLVGTAVRAMELKGTELVTEPETAINSMPVNPYIAYR
jgi:putative inorganic carbon (HCO3(-)) transporter